MKVIRLRTSRKAIASRLLRVLLVCASALIPGAPSIAAGAEAAGKLAPGFHAGIPSGLTAEGHPYLGDVAAPVTIEEFSDYVCPFCEAHYRRTLPALAEKYVRTGKVKYVFRDFPIASLHPPAPAAAAAALCVAEQGAERFWAMHDRLFESRGRWPGAPSPDQLLSELASSAGADMRLYEDCMQSGRTKAKVDASIAEGQKLGFNGTPSFRFTSKSSTESYKLQGAQPIEKFSEWIDALLAGQAPPTESAPQPGKLPYWASPEGLAPDPKRPGFTTAGDPYKGNPKAALVVVEFSDFQCPSCRRHALETEPVLDEKFVAPGKLLWVFKNLPLAMHANAPAAAAAAECAGDQGKFWDMEKLLFAEVDRWSADDPDRAIIELAGRAGVSLPRFRTCFDGRPAMERVLRDLYDSNGVATTTPTFILIQDGRGRVINGAQPTDHFVKIIEQALSEPASSGKN